MAKLSDDQEKQLNDLLAMREAPDDDDDFEIEIYDGSKGARVPYRKGKSFLSQHFGIDLEAPPAESAPPADAGGGKAPKKSEKTPAVSSRYFGKQGGKE
jgi:hypothetical protein